MDKEDYHSLPVIHGEPDGNPFLECDVPDNDRPLEAERAIDTLELGSFHDYHLSVQSARGKVASYSRDSTSAFELNIPGIIDSTSSCILSRPELDKVGCVGIAFRLGLCEVTVRVGGFRHRRWFLVLEKEDDIVEHTAGGIVTVGESDRLGAFLAKRSLLFQWRRVFSLSSEVGCRHGSLL